MCPLLPLLGSRPHNGAAPPHRPWAPPNHWSAPHPGGPPFLLRFPPALPLQVPGNSMASAGLGVPAACLPGSPAPGPSGIVLCVSSLHLMRHLRSPPLSPCGSAEDGAHAGPSVESPYCMLPCRLPPFPTTTEARPHAHRDRGVLPAYQFGGTPSAGLLV